MRSIVLLVVLVVASVFTGMAQGSRSWVEKTAKETEKLLTNSPWAQTQTETDTTEMFYSPTRPGTSAIGQSASAPRTRTNDQQAINNNRTDRGATNQAVSVNYYVRFFSAKPIREAISRVILLGSVEPGPFLIDQMQTLVDRDFGPFVVLTVNCESEDGRFLGPSMQAFASATAGTLRNSTYLERKDGKRLYLAEYRAPTVDGLGAKFVFPRTVDGKPFLTNESGTVRFYSEVGTALKINVKYKITDMVIEGKLEY